MASAIVQAAFVCPVASFRRKCRLSVEVPPRCGHTPAQRLHLRVRSNATEPAAAGSTTEAAKTAVKGSSTKPGKGFGSKQSSSSQPRKEPGPKAKESVATEGFEANVAPTLSSSTLPFEKSGKGGTSGRTRRAAPKQPVLVPTQEASEQQRQIDTAFVVTLGFAFLLILGEGLFLSVSGFLPSEWDNFALEVVYPSFSPTVGVFLVGAVAYALFKVLGSNGSGTGAK